MERKFTRGLNKPGMAAQLRESVSQVVRESAVLVSCVFCCCCCHCSCLCLWFFSYLLWYYVFVWHWSFCCCCWVCAIACCCFFLRVLCVGATVNVNVNVNEINNLFSTVIKFYSMHILHTFPLSLAVSVAMFHRNSLLYFHFFLGKHPNCLIVCIIILFFSLLQLNKSFSTFLIIFYDVAAVSKEM